jgi:DNA-binding LacI/PurR family transcriptional regulator
MIPFVVLDGQVEGVKHDSVVIDQRHGAEAMVKHLINDCGAKRIVFVGGLKTNIDTIDRLEAYKDVMQRASLPVNDDDVYHLDFSYEKAFQLASKLVEDWADTSAFVFAANDEMAAGIIDAAIEKGISVPDQLRVVGFDDTRIAQMTRPRLTTVHVPMSSMGALAVEVLCQRLKDPQRPPTKMTLQSDLVVRESCGSATAKSL